MKEGERSSKRGGAFHKKKKTSSNGGEVIESFLFENLGFRYKKKNGKQKTRGSGVPRPKRLGIGSERAFSTSRVLSAGSVEVWTARRAGAKRGRILEDSGRHA